MPISPRSDRPDEAVRPSVGASGNRRMNRLPTPRSLWTSRVPPNVAAILRHRESQPDPGLTIATSLIAAEERLEDTGRFVGRESAASILDADGDRLPLARDPDFDRRPRRAELAGILQQVVHELGQEERMDRNDHRREVADSTFKVTCSRVDRPPAKVVGHPTREVHRLGLGMTTCRTRQHE